jgi:adenosylcobinamide-GDP ribazoletransferase
VSTAEPELERAPHAPLWGAGVALGLLTILPAPRGATPGEAGELGSAAPWFPLVGALVGGLAGGVRIAAQPLGALPASGLSLTALIALTGALHQDGLADTADGWGARGGGAQRRLQAMRDSAIGAFGVLALVWWGLLALVTLAALSGRQALYALLAAGALSRWAALLHARAAPPARADGLGAAFAVDAPRLAVASAVALAVAMAPWGIGAGLGAALAAGCVAVGMAAIARTTLGGRTGDTLGATVALSELAVLLVLLATVRH